MGEGLRGSQAGGLQSLQDKQSDDSQAQLHWAPAAFLHPSWHAAVCSAWNLSLFPQALLSHSRALWIPSIPCLGGKWNLVPLCRETLWLPLFLVCIVQLCE